MCDINFVDINSYSEKRHIYKLSFEEFMVLANHQADTNNNNNEIHDNKNYSILEILTSNNVRMYFDIENIPNENIIFNIIDDIKKYANLNCDYALTQNNNSRHDGLSYHLYFPVQTTKNDIYNFIKYLHFKTNNIYFNYIDYRVYSFNRLFRIVGSVCPSRYDNVKKIIDIQRNFNDYHKLIHGNLEDTIIQNYNKLIKWNFNFNSNEIENINDNFNKNKNINNKNIKFSITSKCKWDNFKYQYHSINIINDIIYKLKNNNIKENNNIIEEKEKNNIIEENEKDNIIEEKEKEKEKDNIIKEKDNIIKEKDNIIKEKDNIIEEKDNIIEENNIKDNIIEEKKNNNIDNKTITNEDLINILNVIKNNNYSLIEINKEINKLQNNKTNDNLNENKNKLKDKDKNNNFNDKIDLLQNKYENKINYLYNYIFKLYNFVIIFLIFMLFYLFLKKLN